MKKLEKTYFEIIILIMIIPDIYGLFSPDYKVQIIENKINFSPTWGSLLMTSEFEIAYMLLLFKYLDAHVGYNLALGYFILENVSCIIGNIFLYTNILTNNIFFILDKVIAIVEIIMLIQIGYKGLQ